MATILDNHDGTLSVQLTGLETATFNGLPLDQLQNFVTLWLADKAPGVLAFQFAHLSLDDQAEMRSKLGSAAKGQTIE